MKKIEIFIRHIFLRILLFFLSNRNKRLSAEKNNFSKDSKILFIRLNRIGDALVSTPILKIIKQNLQCGIYILADKKNHFIFKNNPYVNKVIIFDKGLKGFRETLSFINEQKFDAIVDLHDDVSTTVTYLLAFSKVPNKFGLSKRNNMVYTQTIDKLPSQKFHVIERNLELAKLFNIIINKVKVNVEYFPDEKLFEKTSNLLKKKFPEKKFLIGINISAGSPARFWGTERFIKLTDFLSKNDVNVLLLCSTRDIQLALQINKQQEHLFYSPSFEEFSAMISHLDLLFTPDTSIVHIASAFCVPVFGLYVKYNTNDMIWSPYKSDFDCIITEEPNFENLSYEQVINKFQPFLEKILNERNTTL